MDAEKEFEDSHNRMNGQVNPTPQHGTSDPGIPAPPTLPQDGTPPPGQPSYITGTLPTHQSNPSSIPRIPAAAGSLNRPKTLQIPGVLTTPTPQAGVPNQNVRNPLPPPYYMHQQPGFQNTMPGAQGGQMPIMIQPGMQRTDAMRAMLAQQQRQMMMGQQPGGMMGQQPGGMMASFDNGWVVPPQELVNGPPGLEYLAEIDQLLIHQQIELLEVLTGFETQNKYMIRNTLGQGVYFAAEESTVCNRVCLGPSRPFDMNIYDHYQNIIIQLQRPFACAGCCCPCCLQHIEVSAPPGNVIGSIHQNWSLFLPRFSVKDATGSTLMKIHGPCCTASCCCSDVEFGIKTANGKEELGRITKQWSGYVQEAYTNADNFSITFPLDMDVTSKALLLAAVFLIDFMYYEHSNNRRR